MSQRDVGAQPPPPVTDEAWHDKVLTDAIGYTRGLVTLLDSLNEAFRRRGRDLAEGRQRLELLQGERRKILEERAVLEERIRALGGERDRTRGDLELRSRELDQARADLKRAHEAGQSQGREIESLRASLTEASRQAARLDLVQKERQTLLEERAALEEQVRELGSECDLLHAIVLEKDSQLEELRAEAARTRDQLGAHADGLRSLQGALASAGRQAEDLREIVRALERDRENTARRHAARLAEESQARERAVGEAVRSREESAALRKARGEAEHRLEAARRDLAAAQVRTEALRADAEAEANAQREALEAERVALRAAADAERVALREAVEVERRTQREAAEAERIRSTAERDAARLEVEQRLQAHAASQEELTQLQTAIQAASEALRERDARLEDLGRLADDLEGRLCSVGAELDAARADSARLSADTAALTAELAEAERELARARDDRVAFASRSQQAQVALDEARSTAAQLEAAVRTQEGERARLAAAVESLRGALGSVATALGQPVPTAEIPGTEIDPAARWRALVDGVRAQRTAREQAEAERDQWRALVLDAQEVVGATLPLPERLRDLMAERRDFAERLEALARENEALRGALADATERATVLEAERDRVVDQAALLTAEVQALRASSTPAAAPPEPQPDAARSSPGPQPESPAPSSPLANGRPRAHNGQAPGVRKVATALDLRAVLLLTREPEGASGTEPVQATGPVSAINHAGMVIALNQTVPLGQSISIRLLRKGVTMTVLGSVVRTQSSSAAPGAPLMVDHLIRFEHPGPESPAQLKAFLAERG